MGQEGRFRTPIGWPATAGQLTKVQRLPLRSGTSDLPTGDKMSLHPATKGASGFTMLELLLTLLITGVIAAMAVPSALNSLRDYHLHSDTSAMANFLNLARMDAARQYAPYALDLDPSVTPATFTIEKLASATYDPLNPSSSGAYASLSPQVFELGTQYASTDSTFAICRPAGVSAYPGPITADPGSCTGPFQFCFNTRGMPVQCAASGSPGTPLPNGGIAIYMQNPNELTDAVTMAAGGVVQAWNWNTATTKWYLR